MNILLFVKKIAKYENIVITFKQILIKMKKFYIIFINIKIINFILKKI